MGQFKGNISTFNFKYLPVIGVVLTQ